MLELVSKPIHFWGFAEVCSYLQVSHNQSNFLCLWVQIQTKAKLLVFLGALSNSYLYPRPFFFLFLAKKVNSCWNKMVLMQWSHVWILLASAAFFVAAQPKIGISWLKFHNFKGVWATELKIANKWLAYRLCYLCGLIKSIWKYFHPNWKLPT